MASKQLNGLIPIESGRAYAACLSRTASRDARIARDREKLIIDRLAKPKRRWSWQRLWFVNEPWTRDEAITFLKRSEIGYWSPWDEVEMVGDWEHGEVVQLERSLAKVSPRTTIYLTTYMATVLYDYL